MTLSIEFERSQCDLWYYCIGRYMTISIYCICEHLSNLDWNHTNELRRLTAYSIRQTFFIKEKRTRPDVSKTSWRSVLRFRNRHSNGKNLSSRHPTKFRERISSYMFKEKSTCDSNFFSWEIRSVCIPNHLEMYKHNRTGHPDNKEI